MTTAATTRPAPFRSKSFRSNTSCACCGRQFDGDGYTSLSGDADAIEDEQTTEAAPTPFAT
jgi:hypothetical protein